MKRFFYILLITIISMSLSSCNNDNDDLIWDFPPLNVVISIVDEDGNNLLYENNPGNWLSEDFSVTFNDQTYPVDWDVYQRDTRMFLAIFRGLYAEEPVFPLEENRNLSPEKRKLLFGAFDWTNNYDLSLTFHVPTLNRSYQIKVVHRFAWKNKKPKSSTKVTLDGQECKDGIVTIVLPRRVE